MAKRTRGNPIPLIVEDHPDTYNGYPFITLIQYRKDHNLTVVDNVNDKIIKSYVLDLCGPSNINEEEIINIANEWWHTKKDRFPLSFEFSRLGLTNTVSLIYRTFNIEYVTRVIGPLPKYEMNETHSVRRRKKKKISDSLRKTLENKQ